MHIIGVDEVGYGAWAGPVVSCAIKILVPEIYIGALTCWNENQIIEVTNDMIKKMYPEEYELIKDSKSLSKNNRAKVALKIQSPTEYFIGMSTPSEIDELNIRNANFLAMQRAYEGLFPTEMDEVKNDLNEKLIIIDGNANPKFSRNIVTIVDGDKKLKLISMASILAKEFRDDLMKEYHKKNPVYSWDTNVGYGTAAHSKGILQYGITNIHRKSYAPIRKFLEENP